MCEVHNTVMLALGTSDSGCRFYRGYIGIMEKKMETTILGEGFGVWGL